MTQILVSVSVQQIIASCINTQFNSKLNVIGSPLVDTQHFYEYCLSYEKKVLSELFAPRLTLVFFFTFYGQESHCKFIKGDVLYFSIKFVECRLMQDSFEINLNKKCFFLCLFPALFIQVDWKIVSPEVRQFGLQWLEERFSNLYVISVNKQQKLKRLGLSVCQRQTQWSDLWVRNRPCAALKATCHYTMQHKRYGYTSF